MFQRWYNFKTNKFEYNLNPKHVWYNMLKEETGQGRRSGRGSTA
jgi:hypothetical protein